VPIENPYANSYWLMPADISYRFKVTADYFQILDKKRSLCVFEAHFQSISARSASAVTLGEKSSIITDRK